MMTNPTKRFSDRVDNYVKYRPSYPGALLDFAQDPLDVTPQKVVADVGSGTGILTELFLTNGNPVYAVEPNQEMRQAAERLLRSFPNFNSIDGKAEATTLAQDSVDLITAGQAFHWFDLQLAKREFRRILKPGGWVLLIWNERQISAPFQQVYEQLLRQYSQEYDQVMHRNINDQELLSFFDANSGLQSFPNSQTFDFAGLQGRMLSSSYSPAPGHPNHQPLIQALKEAFEQYQQNGAIQFDYVTKLYFGQLSN